MKENSFKKQSKSIIDNLAVKLNKNLIVVPFTLRSTLKSRIKCLTK